MAYFEISKEITYQEDVYMCKKILSICLSIVLVFSIVAVFSSCGTDADEDAKKYGYDHTDKENTISLEDKTTKAEEASENHNTVEVDSIESLETIIIAYVNDEIAGLNTELAELTGNISTYDKYVKNIDEVESFYEKVSNASVSISIRLREYSVEYAEMIVESDMSTDDMYNAFDALYDCIYEDAAEVLYDGIYDGILKDLYDAFYDGVVSDGVDSTSYSEWYDTSSDAYELWYDTSSDCYEHWYDMQSDVYGFWFDAKGEIYSRDVDGAKDEIADFKEDVKKLKQA